jgi:hypothetical protein
MEARLLSIIVAISRSIAPAAVVVIIAVGSPTPLLPIGGRVAVAAPAVPIRRVRRNAHPFLDIGREVSLGKDWRGKSQAQQHRKS